MGSVQEILPPWCDRHTSSVIAQPPSNVPCVPDPEKGLQVLYIPDEWKEVCFILPS